MIEAENEWVFDSLIGFIKSPIWNLTIDSFVEQKSVVFDSEERDEEKDKEYRILYEEYKGLIDRLLCGLMSDLGITEEQFEEVCQHGNPNDALLANRLQKNFEQIYASNDFEIFVTFMTKTNIELQMQALEILAHKYGLVYDSFLPVGATKDTYLDEEESVKNAIRKSLSESVALLENENDNQTNRYFGQQSDIKEGMKSDTLEEVLHEKSRLEAQRDKLTHAIQTAMVIDATKEVPENIYEPLIPIVKIAIDSPSVSADPPKQIVESVDSILERSNDDVIAPIEENKHDLKDSDLEMSKRSEYLRNQRDKLLSIKKKEREKQLARMEELDMLTKRPNSSKVMRSVVNDKKESETSEKGEQNLAFRRSLAARLKSEVIERNTN